MNQLKQSDSDQLQTIISMVRTLSVTAVMETTIYLPKTCKIPRFTSLLKVPNAFAFTHRVHVISKGDALNLG